MTAEPLEALGLLVAGGGTAIAIAAPSWRGRHLALAAALVAAPVLVAGDVWHEPRFEDLRSSPALIAAGAVGLVAALAAGAAAFRRWAWAFPALAFAVLALRVPIRIGGESSNLLMPLYLVIGAGLLAVIWDGLRARPAPDAGDTPPPASVVWLRRLLAATLALYAIQALYSEDVSNAIENACFFLVPFGALFVLLAEVRWSERLLALVGSVVAAVGLAYAGVAFWEYAARDLILNEELLDSNQLKPFFRVNSIFYDPNVLGRYLGVAIIVLAAGIAWSRGRVRAAVALGAGLVLLAALVLTFSMTSMAALLAGLIVLAWLRYGLRWGIAALAATIVAGAIFVGAGGAERAEIGPQRGLDAETSGRVNLIEGGLELAEERPVWGWGSGAFGRAFFDQIRHSDTTTSHSEPVTVAAEQGIVGLAVYAGLLAAMAGVLFGGRPGLSAARAAVAACVVAMVIHSLAYAGFAIDPATWALLALGVALRAPPDSAPAADPAPETSTL